MFLGEDVSLDVVSSGLIIIILDFVLHDHSSGLGLDEYNLLTMTV